MSKFPQEYLYEHNITEADLEYVKDLRAHLKYEYDNRPLEIRVSWKTVVAFWNEGETVALKERVEYPYFDNSGCFKLMKILRHALHQIYGRGYGQELYEQYTDFVEGPFEQGIKANERYNADPIRKIIREWFYENLP